MSDLQRYIKSRKRRDRQFAKDYDESYVLFKVGYIVKQLRKEAGLTQAELAHKLGSKKSAISRIENHAGDIRLSTLENVARICGKQIDINFHDLT